MELSVVFEIGAAIFQESNATLTLDAILAFLRSCCLRLEHMQPL